MNQQLSQVGLSLSSDEAIRLFSAKWNLFILKKIFAKGQIRYNELLKSIKGINPKMLSKRLKELEDYGLIKKEVTLDVPIKVDYSLSESGEDLAELFIAIDSWSQKWIRK